MRTMLYCNTGALPIEVRELLLLLNKSVPGGECLQARSCRLTICQELVYASSSCADIPDGYLYLSAGALAAGFAAAQAGPARLQPPGWSAEHNTLWDADLQRQRAYRQYCLRSLRQVEARPVAGSAVLSGVEVHP